MKLVFIGISGSGKDTQANLLVERFKFYQIAVGQLLRDRAAKNDELGEEIASEMNSGFVKDGIAFQVVKDFMHNNQHLMGNLIFNGYVRLYHQIETLDSLLKDIDSKLDYAVYFDLPESAAVERLLYRRRCSANPNHIYHLKFSPPKQEGICDIDGAKLIAREDDTPETIHNRFMAFRADNEKIYQEYQRRRQLIVIDASQSIEQIHQELVSKLGL